MNNKKMIIISGIVSLSLAVSSFAAFAVSNENGDATKGKRERHKSHTFGKEIDIETLKARLADKVAKGEMTQEQADKIIAGFEEMKTKKAEMKEKYATMTPEQKAKMKADMEAKRGHGKGVPHKKMDIETLKAKLADKVAKGEMTQEQADKIIADFQAKQAKIAEEKAKFEATTPEQKAQYKADMKAKHGRKGHKATTTPAPSQTN